MRTAFVFPILAAAAGSPAAAQPAAAPLPDKSEYSLADPTPRTALRELSTDRPDKTESPYTVDAGRLQVELDLATYARDRSDGSLTETIGLLPVNLKLGLTNSTDVQLLIDPYVRRTVSDRAGVRRERSSGFGDVTLRLKQNLWGNDGGRTALALMPFVTLPTSASGLGAERAEFGLIVPLAIGVSERIGIGLMTEVDFVGATDGDGYAANFINSATISYAFTDRVGAYAELFSERSSEGGSAWVVTGDLGLTYAVTDDFQLDGGVNIGLTDAAEDLEVFVGVSRRF